MARDALRVVAVPGDVPAGVDERGRAGAGHGARGPPDQLRLDARSRVGPLGGVALTCAWSCSKPYAYCSM